MLGDDCSVQQLWDSEAGRAVPIPDDGTPAYGERVKTTLRWRAQPQLRSSVGDVYEMRRVPGADGPSTRIRVIGRTDDLLIVKGVKLYPAAARDLVAGFAPRVSGVLRLVVSGDPPRVEPPLRIRVERGEGHRADGDEALAREIAARHASADVGAPRGRDRRPRKHRTHFPQDQTHRGCIRRGGRMINDNIPAIDAWCNPFTELGIKTIFTENPEVAFMMGDQWGRHDNMRWHTADEFVAYMDELNISRVCTPSLKMMRYRTREMLSDIPHEHIAELVAAHPDRIVGLAGINPISGMEGVRALERAVREYGFKGAHVHPFGFGIPINEREWWPFYAKCAELDVPVVFQVGHSAEFMPSACGKPILLDDIAIWFPELRLVGGHTGWPWTEELIAMAWKHPNVYIAVSGHAPKYWDPKLVSFLNARRRGHRQGHVGDRLPADHARRGPQPDRRDGPQARGSPSRCCTTRRSTCSSSTSRCSTTSPILGAGTEPLLD